MSDQSKPREWKIFGVTCAEKGSAAYDMFRHPDYTKVIEYSAYEKLEAELKAVKKANAQIAGERNEFWKEAVQLRADLAVYEKALEYYGEAHNDGPDYDGKLWEEVGPETAREALAKVRGK